jgi:hypothetical protein
VGVKAGRAGNSTAYIRYKQPTVDDLDGTVEYDMDDEDDAWLQQFNAIAQEKHGAGCLSEDDLEAILDRLEKEYFYELRRCAVFRMRLYAC